LAWVIIDMDNQNALTSTALLASIWEKEKKDTIELILPFVTYAIGKITSIGNQIDVSLVAAFLSNNFGFSKIPHSVLYKAFTRLTKKSILKKNNHKLSLCKDLNESCRNIDLQQNKVRDQTARVIEELTEYLNLKKKYLLKKDMSQEEVQNYFVKFLESRGYFIYAEIGKLREIPSNENTLHYHISQFIIAEYEKKSELFLYIESIVKGLLLSRVVYGYIDLQYNEKFKDVCMFMDTTLLLHIFGFKGNEDNNAAIQMIEILCNNSVPIKCFRHNYSEVYKIIEAYKFNIRNPLNRYGQTLEYFDELEYSVSDMDRVLANLEDYFKEKNIEIIDTPSLSSDGTGFITSTDFPSVIGEVELKEHLSNFISYRNDDALNNDVSSIAAISTLRRGKPFKKIEHCKALFVTTNQKLAYAAQMFFNNAERSFPLLIDDLELTTLLWLKNHKRFSDLPTLKLIEIARLSLEPTEQIRTEFIKKIEQFKNEPTVTEERAASFRQLIYTEKEKIMELIAANPENIPEIQLDDLEQLSRHHYNSQLANENQGLKRRLNDTERKLWAEADKNISAAGKLFTIILKCFTFIIIAALFFFGVIGLFSQERATGRSIFSVVLLLFSTIGIMDVIVPRLRSVNKIITIFANKWEAKFERKEQERVQKIISNQKDIGI
jgi:hypothetical protein